MSSSHFCPQSLYTQFGNEWTYCGDFFDSQFGEECFEALMSSNRPHTTGGTCTSDPGTCNDPINLSLLDIVDSFSRCWVKIGPVAKPEQQVKFSRDPDHRLKKFALRRKPHGRPGEGEHPNKTVAKDWGNFRVPHPSVAFKDAGGKVNRCDRWFVINHEGTDYYFRVVRIVGANSPGTQPLLIGYQMQRRGHKMHKLPDGTFRNFMPGPDKGDSHYIHRVQIESGLTKIGDPIWEHCVLVSKNPIVDA